MSGPGLPGWARRDDLPDGQREEFAGLLHGMLGQADSVDLPVIGSVAILIERIATMTIEVRRAGEAQDLEPADLRGLQRLLRGYLAEFNGQLRHARQAQTPEAAFVASLKAALSTALREAGPDARLKDFLPVLSAALEQFGV